MAKTTIGGKNLRKRFGKALAVAFCASVLSGVYAPSALADADFNDKVLNFTGIFNLPAYEKDLLAIDQNFAFLDTFNGGANGIGFFIKSGDLDPVLNASIDTNGKFSGKIFEINKYNYLNSDGLTASKAIISGNAIVSGNFGVGGNQNIGGNLTVSKDTNLVQNLNVGGNTAVAGTLIVEDKAELKGGLAVTGNTAINGDASVAGTLIVEDKAELKGGLAVTGNTAMNGDASVAGALIVEDKAELKGGLAVTGNTAMNGDASVAGTLGVSGKTDLNGGLAVKGNTAMNGDASVAGTLEADKVNANSASIDDLKSTNAKIDTLTATTGNIDNLNGTVAHIGTVNAGTINSENLNSTTGYIETLNGSVANIGEVNTNTVNAGTVNSLDLNSATGYIGTLSGQKVQVTDSFLVADGSGDKSKVTSNDVAIHKEGAYDIKLSEVGQIGNVDAELQARGEFKSGSEAGTVVGALNAETAIRREAIGNLNARLDRVGAMAAAAASLKTMGYDPDAPTELAMALGTYHGDQAVAVGVFHYPNRDFMLNINYTQSGSERMGGIGATWKFGRKLTAEEKAAKAKAKVANEQAKLEAANALKAKADKVKAQQAKHAKLLAAKNK